MGRKRKGLFLPVSHLFLRKGSKKDRKTCPLDIPVSFPFTTERLGDSLMLRVYFYITQGRKSQSGFIRLSPTVTQHLTYLASNSQVVSELCGDANKK